MKNKKMSVIMVFLVVFAMTFSNITTVSKAVGATIITLSNSIAPVNGTIDVTIANAQIPTKAKDWVGLYEENVVPDGNPVAIWWGYIADLGVTDGNGTFTFDPANIASVQKSRYAAGKTYKFILAYNDNFTVIASVNFNTTASQTPSIKSFNPINISTNVGVMPQLPTTVTANYSDGTTGTVTVIWNNLDPLQYSKAGSFTIKGRVDSTGVVPKVGVTVNEFGGPILKFQAISDVHIRNNTQSDIYYMHFQGALNDMNRINPDSNALIFVGDIANTGAVAEYDAFNSILASIPHATPYFALGNHEIFTYTNYNTAVSNFLTKTGMSSVYRDTWINGYHFIFLGSESISGNKADISNAQLQWLQQKLGENSSPDKPVFIFMHQPLADTVAGSTVMKDVIPDKQLKEILSQFPQSILISGHTHEVLTASNEFYNNQICGMANTGSVAYLWYVPTNKQPGNGSQGLFVDVYQDKVIIKGREFTSQEWIAQYTFRTPPTGLTAVSSNSIAINVAWNAVSGAVGYDLEVDGTVISNVQNPYLHAGLTNGSTHTYRVRIKNMAGTSSTWSLPSSATVGLSAVDLGLNKTVTVDSTFGAGYESIKAADGYDNTRWASSSTSGAHWITTDLLSSQNVNMVKLNWEAAFGVDYKIQTSTDNATWTTVATITGNNSRGYKSYTFPTTNARYVRVYSTKSTFGTLISLYSFNIYNQ